MKNTSSFKDEFIESAGEIAANLSFSRSIGQIYALLYISQEPLSLDDLCEYLKISKGNGSTNLRNLDQWRAIQKVWIKGSRRVHYSAIRDLKALALKRVEEGVRRRLTTAQSLLANLESHLEDDFSRERLKEIKSFAALIEEAISLVPRAQELLNSPLLRAFIHGK